jgi:transposase-like protein
VLHMKIDADFPETLKDAIPYFAQPEKALAFMIALRWPDGVICCPNCGHDDAMFMPKRMVWRCRGCNKQFSAKVGTIFEDSPLGYDKWLPALWLIGNAKNGISSCEVARALGVTQKTGWFMLHRIRLAMQNGTIVKMGGHVEVDETFIGGKGRFMNAERKAKQKKGHGHVNMSPVQGLLERSRDGKTASRVILQHVEGTKAAHLTPNVRKYVLRGSVVNTDQSRSYNEIEDEYVSEVINHAKAYAHGKVHVNGLENFWSLLKRTIRGTYVSVEPSTFSDTSTSKLSGSTSASTRTATVGVFSRWLLASSASD